MLNAVFQVQSLVYFLTPAFQVDKIYSGFKGHLWRKYTWLIRTLDRVPTLCKYILIFPWNKDTSLIGTNILVPMVSVLAKFHCTTRSINFYNLAFQPSKFL